MNKFTPGPWAHNGCQITSQGDMRLIVGLALSESDVLANRYAGHAAKTQKDGEANARLMAAAPELLEALMRVRNAFYVDGSSKALRAAFEGTKELVAKAKGES